MRSRLRFPTLDLCQSSFPYLNVSRRGIEFSGSHHHSDEGSPINWPTRWESQIVGFLMKRRRPRWARVVLKPQ